jgi:hypothetical protein
VREYPVCGINTAEAARINLDNKCKRSKNQVDSFSLLVFDGTPMYRWIIERRLYVQSSFPSSSYPKMKIEFSLVVPANIFL